MSLLPLDFWRDDAACRARHDLDWFPTKVKGRDDPYTARVSAAKAVCALCPVRDACLAAALGEGHQFGIRGGQTPSERRRLIRSQHRRRVAACGTNSGYYRHHDQGEPSCEECRTAHSAAVRHWRTT